MGGMISKYVTQSIKEMMESINKKIEDGISFDRYKRKIKSKVTGVSESEILLQESDNATISSIFIIEKESGMLIVESQLGDIEIDDAHMVASMASAIKDFINDWIQDNSRTSEVQILSYGDATLYIESAGSVYMVAFLDSEPDFELRSNINNFFATLVKEYSTFFQTFDGDDSSSDIKELTSKIDNYLQKQIVATETGAKKKKVNIAKYIIWIFIVFILGYTGYSLYISFIENQLEQEIKSKTQLDIDIQYKDGFVYLNGFVDSTNSTDTIKYIVTKHTDLPIKSQLIPSINSINTIMNTTKKDTEKDLLERTEKKITIHNRNTKGYIETLESKIVDLQNRVTLSSKYIKGIELKILNLEKRFILKTKQMNSKIVSTQLKLNRSEEILKETRENLENEITKSNRIRDNIKKVLSVEKSVGEKLTETLSNNKFYKKNDLSLDFSGLNLFSEGNANYDTGKMEILNKTFEKYINTLNGFGTDIASVQIEGYTSSNGSNIYNLELSKQRAESVLKYIMSRYSIEKYPIIKNTTAHGMGSKSIIIKNGIEDKEASRRIKVRFKIKSDRIIKNIKKILS